METKTITARQLRAGQTLVGASGLTYPVERVWRYTNAIRIQVRGVYRAPTFHTFAKTAQLEVVG
jgi:hypothetical protein